MLKLEIYDAAGPTRLFFYDETTAPVPIAFGPRRLVSEATVLDGRLEGETVRGELIGRFDVATGQGEIDVMRQLVDGERHFEVAFHEPVGLDRIEEDIAAAFEGPIEAVGNQFANLLFGGRDGDRLSGGGGADRLASGGADDLLRGAAARTASSAARAGIDWPEAGATTAFPAGGAGPN